MKVLDLVNKLNEIGYDENTEQSFSCVDGNIGECYDISFEEICFGETLIGQLYCNDIIDIGVDVDVVKVYFKAKFDSCMHEMIDELRGVLYDYDSIDVE